MPGSLLQKRLHYATMRYLSTALFTTLRDGDKEHSQGHAALL